MKEVSTPTCQWCEKKLTPNYSEIKDDAPGLEWYKQKKFKIRIRGYGYGNNGYFCSLTCGYQYAVATMNDWGDRENKRAAEIRKANEDRGFLADGELPYKAFKEVVNKLHQPERIRMIDSIMYEKAKKILLSNYNGDLEDEISE